MCTIDSFADYGEDKYIQDAVLVKSVSPCNIDVDFYHNLGTLSVVYYQEPIGKCVEWRQCELTVEEDQEWEIVKDSNQRRCRTRSGCGSTIRPPTIQLKLSELKSFRLSKSDNQITLISNDNFTSCCFSFQRGSAQSFVNYLTTTLPTSQCRKDRKLYLVMDQPDVQNLSKSFAELELFPENKSDAVWNFMRRLHDSPYETTLITLSKVSDTLLFKPKEEDEERVAELLSQSLSAEEPERREEYEVVSRQTPLPPRTVPPRIRPLSVEQWAIFFDDRGAIPESTVLKEIIFHGSIDPCIRKDVWKFLLDYYPWNSTYEERELIRRSKTEEYYRMKLQWKTITKEQEDRFSDYKERKSLIEKDVTRTDRTLAFYADDNNPNLQLLQDILMTYVMYNFDLGYVQGMSDLLSPLLYIMEDEVDTFWCFTTLIRRMVKNFDVDQAGMKEQLQQLYQLVNTADPEFANYLHKQESSNMFFCFRWLLVWFKREFAFDEIYILWETLWAESCCPNYHLLICLAILDTEKDTIMKNEYGFTEILKHVNELSNRMILEDILRKAEGLYVQLTSATDIPNSTRVILGMPTLPEENPEGNISNSDDDDAACSAVENHLELTSSDELGFEKSLNMQFL